MELIKGVCHDQISLKRQGRFGHSSSYYLSATAAFFDLGLLLEGSGFVLGPSSFGLCGFGGVSSIRRKTLSSAGAPLVSLGLRFWFDWEDFVMQIMPAFRKSPDEAAIIGRLLAGYGELEFSLAFCLGVVLGDHIVGIKAFFRLRSESSRLEVTDALMRDAIAAQGIEGEYAQAIGCIRHCLKIRNKYAHCHWAVDTSAGLFFTSMQDTAESALSLVMLP